jgi:hypothetical protein
MAFSDPWEATATLHMTYQSFPEKHQKHKKRIDYIRAALVLMFFVTGDVP